MFSCHEKVNVLSGLLTFIVHPFFEKTSYSEKHLPISYIYVANDRPNGSKQTQKRGKPQIPRRPKPCGAFDPAVQPVPFRIRHFRSLLSVSGSLALS
jgi:hypothetical protein